MKPQTKPDLPTHVDAALCVFLGHMTELDVVWALTGSTAHVLQGVPLKVGDIDVQTDAEGARRIVDHFERYRVSPVEFEFKDDRIRSHFGTLRLAGVEVEVMGDVETRNKSGEWTPAPPVADVRRMVPFRDWDVPVMPLEVEWRAYERYGRPRRARLLRQHLGLE